MAGYSVLGSMTPDNLIGGHEVPLLTTKVTLLAGQGVLKRGSVIGIITTGGKGKLCNVAGTDDGSRVAKYILAKDVDTTADAPAVVYKSGIFNRNALIFGGTDTPTATHEAELIDLGIHLREEL